MCFCIYISFFSEETNVSNVYNPIKKFLLFFNLSKKILYTCKSIKKTVILQHDAICFFIYGRLQLAELSSNNLKFDAFIQNPLTIPDISTKNHDIRENLNMFCGFPDPFLNGSEQFYRLWSQTYKKPIIAGKYQGFCFIMKLG